MIPHRLPFLLSLLLAPTTLLASGVNASGAVQGTELYNVGALNGPVSGSGSYIGAQWNLQAASHADYTSWGTYASGHRDDNFSGGMGAGAVTAFALSDDRVTFSGGTATYTLHYSLEGFLAVDGARFTTAEINFRVRVGGGEVLLFDDVLRYDDPRGNIVNISRTLASDPFTINDGADAQLTVNMFSQAILEGFSGETPDATSDFQNTVKFLYFEARDANGALMSGITATGETGTVYAVNPVPEPTSLAALGIAALVFRRRTTRA